MSAEVESMMYAREVPWHGFGTKVDGLQTAEEAIVAAGLDWEVVSRPIYIRQIGTAKGKIVKVPGYVANVRNRDSAPLGVVSPGYRVVQNRTAFAMADEIVATGEAKYETAGSLREGRVVFLSMEIPKTVKVPGDDGDVKPYLLLVNSHDGSRAMRGVVTPIRTVCMNTMTLALREAHSEFRLRHTVNVMERVAEARAALGLTVQYLDAFESWAEKMVLSKVTPQQTLRTLLQVFPMKDVNPLKLSVEEMRRVIAAEPTTPAAKALSFVEHSPNVANVRGTAWGVLNGVAEYLQYGQFFRKSMFSAADNRVTSIVLNGPAAQKQQKAATILASLS